MGKSKDLSKPSSHIKSHLYVHKDHIEHLISELLKSLETGIDGDWSMSKKAAKSSVQKSVENLEINQIIVY